jgi:plastocyanin
VAPLRAKEITGHTSSSLPDGTTLRQVPTSFDLTFAESGTYPYRRVLHWDLGHVGTVKVN